MTNRRENNMAVFPSEPEKRSRVQKRRCQIARRMRALDSVGRGRSDRLAFERNSKNTVPRCRGGRLGKYLRVIGGAAGAPLTLSGWYGTPKN